MSVTDAKGDTPGGGSGNALKCIVGLSKERAKQIREHSPKKRVAKTE